MSTRVSEGTLSALQIVNAIGYLHGSERPDVSLRPYVLEAHSHARIDIGFTREGGMAVSNAYTMPLGHQVQSARS